MAFARLKYDIMQTLPRVIAIAAGSLCLDVVLALSIAPRRTRFAHVLGRADDQGQQGYGLLEVTTVTLRTTDKEELTLSA